MQCTLGRVGSSGPATRPAETVLNVMVDHGVVGWTRQDCPAVLILIVILWLELGMCFARAVFG